MKFGKQLKQTVQDSLPEWRPNFLDYKDLKKKINGEVAGEHVEGNSDSSAEATARSSSERPNTHKFLEALRTEVEKVNNFFLDMEEDFIIRFQLLGSRVDDLKKEDSVDRRKVQDLCRKLIDFQGELVLLENFSVINYTGFRKILKKHDKKTGLDLRNTFLLAVLDTPFFLSNSLRRLMNEVENKLLSLDMYSKFRRTSSYRPLSGGVRESTVQYGMQPVVKLLENGDEASASKLMRHLDGASVDKVRVHWKAMRMQHSSHGLVLDSTDDHFIGIAVVTPAEKLQFHVKEGQTFGKCLTGQLHLRRAKDESSPVRDASVTGPWPAIRFRQGEFHEWENRSNFSALILMVMIPGFHGDTDQFSFPTDENGTIKISQDKKILTLFPAL
ncbi:hypothetical protein NDN08_004432 [Rhodosorus marinus]|uniref:SPX domain-containing protein n=1 Tax=Rhodosorus marinus TaxID=101924 RepID=A0AAV8UMR7_9RHOD|nr:hypothetical protein NDN08_004432 [Rhodosorus marinus]